MTRLVFLAMLLAACASPPVARAPDAKAPSAVGEIELGCFRVDAGAEGGARVVLGSDEPGADARPPGFEDGTLYCIERDRFFVKKPGAGWNAVLAQWSVRRIWSVRGRGKEAVGTSWLSDGAPRLVDSPPLSIDLEDGDATHVPRPTHWDAQVEACPIEVVSEAGATRLDGAWSVPLVRLAGPELEKARAEIRALAAPELTCEASYRAGHVPVLTDVESVTPVWSRRLHDLESCRVQAELAKARAMQHGRLLSCRSTEHARCPYGSSRQRGECVYREVVQRLVCPKGSRRHGELCVIDDVYPAPPPDPAPSPPGPSAPAATGTAFAHFNSIPQCQVILDGRPLGQTPIVKARLSAGHHVVIFVHPEHGRKSRTFELGAGQTKTVVVRFP